MRTNITLILGREEITSDQSSLKSKLCDSCSGSVAPMGSWHAYKFDLMKIKRTVGNILSIMIGTGNHGKG